MKKYGLVAFLIALVLVSTVPKRAEASVWGNVWSWFQETVFFWSERPNSQPDPVMPLPGSGGTTEDGSTYKDEEVAPVPPPLPPQKDVTKPTITQSTRTPVVVSSTVGNAQNASFEFIAAMPPMAVTGPVEFGVIDWGDGITEKVIALSNEEHHTKTHVYKTAGTYNATFTHVDGRLLKTTFIITPSTVSSYGASDIASIKIRQVDPIPGAIDDEYSEYAITLKDGTVYKVPYNVFAGPGMFMAELQKTGYIGTVSELDKFVQ